MHTDDRWKGKERMDHIHNAHMATSWTFSVCALQRHNIIGLLLWAPFHCLIRLPLRHLIGRVRGAAEPPFSWRAQSFIDATKYCTHELDMDRLRSTLNLMAPEALAKLRCPMAPVLPLTPAASLLSNSRWFGSADLSDSISVLVYCHGGGFCIGSAHMYPGPFCHIIDQALAAGVTLRILSVEYPLAHEIGPEGGPDSEFATNGYQRAIETVIAAFDYLQDEIGIPSHSILFGGDSAGGNLAVTSCLALRDRAWRQGACSVSSVCGALPAGLVLFSPLTNMSASARWRTRHDPQDAFFADNLDYLSAALAQRFTRIFLGNSERYAQEARQRGVRGWLVGEEEDARGASGDAADADFDTDFSSAASSATPSRRSSAALALDDADQAEDAQSAWVSEPRSPDASSLPAAQSDLSSFSLVSPLFADLSSLPPVHLCYGGRELLEIDIRDFQSALVQAGVAVSETFDPRMTHNYALTREAFGHTSDAAMSSVTDFITRTLLTQKHKHITPKEALARNLFSTAHFIDAQP